MKHISGNDDLGAYFKSKPKSSFRLSLCYALVLGSKTTFWPLNDRLHPQFSAKSSSVN
jgi:hypothetical protein